MENHIMQKAICISERKNSKRIEIGNSYYIDLMSLVGDADGEWFVDVYTDDKKEIGRFRLNHFKSVV